MVELATEHPIHVWVYTATLQLDLLWRRAAVGHKLLGDISRIFFPGKHFIQFLALKMKEIRNCLLHNCILVFDAEPVNLKLQVTILKNKEVTVNPKPQTLEKKMVFQKPYTLNPIP